MVGSVLIAGQTKSVGTQAFIGYNGFKFGAGVFAFGTARAIGRHDKSVINDIIWAATPAIGALTEIQSF